MKNEEVWKESKYKIEHSRLKASDDTREVSGGSWLITQMIADVYTRIIPENVNGKVLELGCGKVPLYGFYKDNIDEVVCYDWAESLHGNMYIDDRVDITKELPISDEEFDVVICSDVLEHIFNPIDVLNEMKRVTKRGGKIIISTPFYYWLHETPYDYYRYTPFFFKKYVSETGDLNIKECILVGGVISCIADILGKILMKKSGKLAQLFQKIIYIFVKRQKMALLFPLEMCIIFEKTETKSC